MKRSTCTSSPHHHRFHLPLSTKSNPTVAPQPVRIPPHPVESLKHGRTMSHDRCTTSTPIHFFVHIHDEPRIPVLTGKNWSLLGQAKRDRSGWCIDSHR